MDIDQLPDRQRMVVVPRPDRDAAADDPWTGQLLVTDVGVFPRAAGHYREREAGAEEWVVAVCVAGAGRLQHGAAWRPVGPGSVVVLPPRQAHAYEADARDPWTMWWLHLAGPQMDRLGAAGWLPVGVSRHPEPRLLAAAIGRVLAALERGTDQRQRAEATTAAWAVVGQLHLSTAPPEDPVVATTIATFHEHLIRPVALTSLARQAGLSASQFSARFKAATGASPIDYLIRLRMERAAWLLTNGTAAIETVARQVGYDDPAYFSRRFTRHHGCSPRTWRER